MKSLWLILTLFILKVQAATDLVPYYAVPEPSAWLLDLEYQNLNNEMEYEINGDVTEERQERRKVFITNLKHGLKSGDVLGLKVSAGTFRADYAYSTPPLDHKDYQVSGNGYEIPTLEYYHQIKPHTFERQLYFSFRPRVPNQDEDDFYDSNMLVELKYIFSYHREYYQTNLSLETIYIGKKKIKGHDNSYETWEDDHSNFRFYANQLYRIWKNIVIGPELSFGMTTNYYVRKNPTPKSADKGFTYLVGLNLNYIISDNHLIGINHNRSSEVYNPMGQPLDLNIDYEYEREAWLFRYKYAW